MPIDKYYNELVFSVDKYRDLFIDLVFSFGVDAVEEKSDSIIVRASYNLDDVFFGLQSFADMLNLNNFHVSFSGTCNVRENKDWIEEYRNNIQPIMVDRFYVHTTWQDGIDGAINIIIDPALAFGSGHHETTYSCLKLLQKYTKPNQKAIDVGCGSGILSIAMAKLGAVVDACDTDELAIKSLNNNLEHNNTLINKSWIGSVSNIDDRYDLVVANIISDVILMLQYDLKRLLNNNGILILSGILDKYEKTIKDNFKDMILIEEFKNNEWVTLVYKAGIK